MKLKCQHCDGTGKQELPGEYLQTLELVRMGFDTTDALLKRLPGVNRTAQGMRLNRLMSMGLVKRERAGKSFVYSLTRKASK